jgi:phosphate transport system protein
MKETSGDLGTDASKESTAPPAFPSRHALRDQEILWVEFLEMGREVVESLAKSIAAFCEGRLDVVPEVKKLEERSDSAEVRIEQECLRVLALFEPVASDLRRLATVLKVSRDWERIADLAARIARRARKLAKSTLPVPVPDLLKSLAHDVLAQAIESFEALANRDTQRARAVIDGGKLINRQQRRLRGELKESIRRDPGQLDAWLQMMSTARHLERISDHATDIAQSVVYLQEGIIIRHKIESPADHD